MGRVWRSMALAVAVFAVAGATVGALTGLQGVRATSRSTASCGPSHDAAVATVDRRRDAVFMASRESTVVAFLGDSYTAGVPLHALADGYAARAAALLHVRPWIAGRGGTGYRNGGPCGGATYGARLADALREHPAVLVVEGSVNDWRSAASTVGAAALALYRRVALTAPATRLVVLGPCRVPGIPARPVEAIDAALRAAAARAGATYVSDLSWLAGRGLVAPDGIHPSAAGHELIADRLAAALRAAGVGGQ